MKELPKIYFERVCGEPRADYPALMSRARRAQLERFTNREALRLAIAAELLLVQAYSEYTGRPEAPVEWAADSYGKPYLPDDPGFHFSLSHTSGFAVCAAHNANVGVDCERVRDPGEKLARRIMTEREYAGYIAAPCRAVEFARLWTRKEAYAKFTGLGIGIGMNTVTLSGEGGAELISSPGYPPALILGVDTGEAEVIAAAAYELPDDI